MSLSTVDLPEPDAPTMAVFLFAGTSKVTLRSDMLPLYPKETPSNRSTPSLTTSGGALGREETFGVRRSSSSSWRMSVRLCRISWYVKPSAVSGACSCRSMPWIATTSPIVRAPDATRDAQSAMIDPSPAEKMSACPALSTDTSCTSRTESTSSLDSS